MEREVGERRVGRVPGPSDGLGFRPLLLLLILLGFALRVLRLDLQPLWWDEGYSVWFATHSVSQMAGLTAQDIHPPLYYALLHGWIGLWGAGPVALRLFSAWVGVLAIPAIYLAGRRLLGPRPAVLAALLLAINPLHIFYSQEVRMYGLVALLSLGALITAARVFAAGQLLIPGAAPRPVGKCPGLEASTGYTVGESDRLILKGGFAQPRDRGGGRFSEHGTAGRRTAALAAYVVFTVAALYTQYYAVFLPIGLTLYALWRWRRDAQSLIRWLAGQTVVALLYLPWVVFATPRLIPYISQKVAADADRPLGLALYLARHLAAFLAGHLEGALSPSWPAALLLAPLVCGWLWLETDQAPGAWRAIFRTVAHAGRGASAQPPCGTVPEKQAGWIRGFSRFGGRRQKPAKASRPKRRAIFRAGLPLLVAVLTTTLLLGWLIGLRYPFFPARGERLLLLALPAFVLLAAAGLAGLWSWAQPRGGLAKSVPYVAVGLFVAAAGASLAAFYTTPRYAADDYRPLISRTVEQGLPEDTVFCVYPWQVGYWRSYASLASGVKGLATPGPTAVLTPDAAWSPDVARGLDHALATGRVWFPAHLALGAVLETQIEAHLAQRAAVCAVAWYGPGTRLSAWAATTADAIQPVNAGPFRFALIAAASPAVELTRIALGAGPVSAANEILPLALTWRGDLAAGPPTGSGRDSGQAAAPPILGVSVRLVDPLGQIWAQHDYEPLAGLASPAAVGPTEWDGEDLLGLLIPAGTPPGVYALEVAVHPKGDDRPLDVFGADPSTGPGRGSGPVGTAARLAEITVTPADRPLGPERLPIGRRQTVDLEDGFRFLGHSAAEGPAAPGDLLKVSLFWQATARPAADAVAFIQLWDRSGALVAGWEAPPGAAYATSRWTPGTLMRTQAAFRLPASLTDGRYRLAAGLFRQSDKTRVRTTRGADHIVLGQIEVRGRPHVMTPPTPRYPADVQFGALGRLVGYDLTGPADSSLTLTLYWQATGATDRAHTVFVHLQDATGVTRGYGDSEPAGGRFPTTSWLPGEYLTDLHRVAIAADTPAGLYRLVIGLYDPATGRRLTTGQGAEWVELDAVVRLGRTE